MQHLHRVKCCSGQKRPTRVCLFNVRKDNDASTLLFLCISAGASVRLRACEGGDPPGRLAASYRFSVPWWSFAATASHSAHVGFALFCEWAQCKHCEKKWSGGSYFSNLHVENVAIRKSQAVRYRNMTPLSGFLSPNYSVTAVNFINKLCLKKPKEGSRKLSGVIKR